MSVKCAFPASETYIYSRVLFAIPPCHAVTKLFTCLAVLIQSAHVSFMKTQLIMKTSLVTLVLSLLLFGGVLAQDAKQVKASKKSAKATKKMDHSKMKMDGTSGDMKGMDHSKMKGMDHSKMKAKKDS